MSGKNHGSQIFSWEKCSRNCTISPPKEEFVVAHAMYSISPVHVKGTFTHARMCQTSRFLGACVIAR